MDDKNQKTTAEDLEYRSRNLQQWADEYAALAKKLRELNAEIAESGGAQFETSVRRPLEANIRRIEARIDAARRAQNARPVKPELKAAIAENQDEYVADKPSERKSKRGKSQQ